MRSRPPTQPHGRRSLVGQETKDSMRDDHLQLAKKRVAPSPACLAVGGDSGGSQVVHIRIRLGQLGKEKEERERSTSRGLPNAERRDSYI